MAIEIPNSTILSFLVDKTSGKEFSETFQSFFQEAKSTAEEANCFPEVQASEYSYAGANLTDAGALGDIFINLAKSNAMSSLKEKLKIICNKEFTDDELDSFCLELKKPEVQLALLLKKINFKKNSQIADNLIRWLCGTSENENTILKEFIALLEREKNENLSSLLYCFGFYIKSCLQNKAQDYKHLIVVFLTSYFKKILENFSQETLWDEKTKKIWRKVIDSLRYVYSVDGLINHLKQVDKLIYECVLVNNENYFELKSVLKEHRDRVCQWFLGVSNEYPFVKSPNALLCYTNILKEQLETKKRQLEQKQTGFSHRFRYMFTKTHEAIALESINSILGKINNAIESGQARELVEHVETLTNDEENHHQISFMHEDLFQFLLQANEVRNNASAPIEETDKHQNFLRLNQYQVEFGRKKLKDIQFSLEKRVKSSFHSFKQLINRIYPIFETQVIEDELNIVNNFIGMLDDLRNSNAMSSDLFQKLQQFQLFLNQKYEVVHRYNLHTQQSVLLHTLKFLTYYFIDSYKKVGIDAFKKSYTQWFSMDLLTELRGYRYQRESKPLFSGFHMLRNSLRYYFYDFFGTEKKLSLKKLNQLEEHLKSADWGKFCFEIEKIKEKLGEKHEMVVLLLQQHQRILNGIQQGNLISMTYDESASVTVVSQHAKDIINEDPDLQSFYSALINRLTNEFLAMRVLATRRVMPTYSYTAGVGYGAPMLSARVAEMTGIPWISTVGVALSSGIFYADMRNTAYQSEVLCDYLTDSIKLDKLVKNVATNMVRIWGAQIKAIAGVEPENVKYFAYCAADRMLDFLLTQRYKLYPNIPIEVLLCASVRLQKIYHGFWYNRFVMDRSGSRFSSSVWKAEDIFEKTPITEGAENEKRFLFKSEDMSNEFGYARDGGVIATQILHLPMVEEIEEKDNCEIRSPATAVPGFSFNQNRQLFFSPGTPMPSAGNDLARKVQQQEAEIRQLRTRVAALELANTQTHDDQAASTPLFRRGRK